MAVLAGMVSRHSPDASQGPRREARSELGADFLALPFPAGSQSRDALMADQPSLAAMASLAVLELENARLRGAERRRREQLDAIRAVLVEIPQPNLDATLACIADQAAALLDGRTGWVWLWDTADAVLVPRRRVGRGDDSAPDRLCLGEGLAGRVAQTRRGLVVNNYRAWPHALPAFLARPALTATMGEPLLSRGRLLGVLTIDNELTGRPFTTEDVQLLQLLAAHASLALANSELAEQVQTDRRHLQGLSRQLVEVQETERRALARELHDEIGQSLTGLRLLLDLHGEPATPGHRRSLADARELVSSLLTRVRQLCLDLRPSMLDDLGLLPALLWQVERYQACTGIQVEFRHTGLEGCRFPPELETGAYRLVQEALTNVARHAAVRQAFVSIWRVEGILGVQVEDRGVGFDPEAPGRTQSSGLKGMQERVTLLGGQFSIDSTPGRGTCIMAEFPLTRASA